MIRTVIATVVATVLAGSALAGSAPAGSQTPAAQGQVLGSVRLTRAVTADGKPLPAGTYEVRLTGQSLPPLAGQTPGGEQYVEFVSNGSVAGRDVAVVMESAAAAAPGPDAPLRVELLKGGDFLRISTTRNGRRYLIHLPVSPN